MVSGGHDAGSLCHDLRHLLFIKEWKCEGRNEERRSLFIKGKLLYFLISSVRAGISGKDVWNDGTYTYRVDGSGAERMHACRKLRNLLDSSLDPVGKSLADIKNKAIL